MTALRVTWPSLVTPNSRESVRGADDKVSALIMALHSAVTGKKMGGDLRGASPHDATKAVLEELEDNHDITPDQRSLWALSLHGRTIGDMHGTGSKPSGNGPIISAAAGVTLDEYQTATIASLPIGGGVAALGCGLGKTATALAAAYTVGANRLFIVCPLNAMGTWEQHRTEMESRFPEVEIVSMDSLHKVKGLEYKKKSVVIFDEVHLLGNIKSQRTKLAMDLRKKFDVGLALTGTLLHGGIEKALAVQNLAVPGLARFSNMWKCGEHFGCIVKQQIGGRTITNLASPAESREAEWAEYLSFGTVVLNSESESVAEAVSIPVQEKHLVEIDHALSNLTADGLVARCVKDLESVKGEFPSMSKTMHFIARLGSLGKANWLKQEMADNELPVVVFCAYTESMDVIESMLLNEGISYVKVDGSVTGNKRTTAVAEFNGGKARVFLGQMEASCTSIDLTRTHISVAVDHSWKAATYDQALARTCRRGQTKRCHHFDLFANGIQKQIIQRLRKNAGFDSKVATYQQLKRVRDNLAT